MDAVPSPAPMTSTVRLWDVEAGHCLRAVKGHKGTPLSLAWSADGRRELSILNRAQESKVNDYGGSKPEGQPETPLRGLGPQREPEHQGQHDGSTKGDCELPFLGIVCSFAMSSGRPFQESVDDHRQ